MMIEKFTCDFRQVHRVFYQAPKSISYSVKSLGGKRDLDALVVARRTNALFETDWHLALHSLQLP